MTKYLRLFVVFLILLMPGIGCDRPLFVNCDECYTDEPSEAELLVKITINNENPKVPLAIYQGTFDTGEEIAQDTVTTESFYIFVKTKKMYTVVAEYHKNGKIIRVVNGHKIKTYLDNESCDSPCYVVTGTTLDARLKF